MKGTVFFLVCVFALAYGSEEEIELNANGCPVDPSIHKNIAHDKYCNFFYTCEMGALVELWCPEGLVFNVENEVCDWPANVDCEGKEINLDLPKRESEESAEARK